MDKPRRIPVGARFLHANIPGGKVAYTVEEINEIVKWMIAFRSRIEKREEGSVTTEMLSDGAVTPEKLNERVATEMIDPIALPEATRALVDEMAAKGVSLEMLTPELQRMLSKAVPVSLEVLNEALNNIWDKIEEMTGEALHGIQMSVSPTYFVGEDGADVHITASSRNSGEKFDQIAFYANNELMVKEKNTDYLEFDFHITEDTYVKCEAYLLGRKYTQEKTITKYSAFWMGAGSDYEEVMAEKNLVENLPQDLRVSKDVTVAEDGQHIILVMGSSLSEGFIRADMNGFEIPFETEDITVDNKSYKVYKSLNTYQAGTYNIDING